MSRNPFVSVSLVKVLVWRGSCVYMCLCVTLLWELYSIWRPVSFSILKRGCAWIVAFVSALNIKDICRVCLPDEVFRSQDQGTPASSRPVSAADVVLYGVNIVLPLMSQDLLKVRFMFFFVFFGGVWGVSPICCSVKKRLFAFSVLRSSRLCATSTTSSSPSSARSSPRRSHCCPRISSRASCSRWNSGWPRILVTLQGHQSLQQKDRSDTCK